MRTIGSCHITTTNDTDKIEFDWGVIHLLCEEPVTGGKTMSFGSVVLQAGQGHIRHNHPTADEIIYVVSGEADQMLDDEEPVRVKAGDCIWIPQGVYHSTINRSDEPIHLIVVYAPAGAEQVLREDPTVKITSPSNQ
ncbi:MAG: cupin domain-containing protein [Chloroflexi bacterium]|nr:cupin domain-containing protein [Chloroflexota bacterium]